MLVVLCFCHLYLSINIRLTVETILRAVMNNSPIENVFWISVVYLSEYNQCIPGEIPMHFIRITGIWEWALPVYSIEIPMHFIRITGSQFGSEFNQCIPGEIPMHFIRITGIWEWALLMYSIEIPMNLIRITGSQFGSEYYHCIPVKFVCLFDLILYVTVNNLSVMLGWVFLGWTSGPLISKD